MSDHVDISNSFLGFGTYVGVNTYLPKTHVGRFSSIGRSVSIIIGAHPSKDFVSTNPVFYNTSNVMPLGKSTQIFQEFPCNNDGFYLHVGNDVWIGNCVKIKQGITIGDGAIIGFGSVVTHDIKPYEIVGGNPAKLIRMRFSKDQIDDLEKIAWWNWPIATILERREHFSDVEEFLKFYKREK